MGDRYIFDACCVYFGLLKMIPDKSIDLVLDPFAGSFTTAVACKELNRRWIACDISEEYCRIGEQRLKKDENPFE